MTGPVVAMPLPSPRTPRLGVAFLLLSVMACQAPSAPEAPALTLKDDRGVTLTRERPATRVLSLSPGHTELLFALGAGDALVGRTDNCDYPPTAAAVPSVGSLFPPDYERMLATRPDVVLMMDGTEAVRTRLTELGLTVLVFQPETVEETLALFPRVGRVVGREAEGEALKAKLDAELARVKAARPKAPVSVFFEVWAEPLSTAGPGSFVDDLLRQAGGQNVAAHTQEPWPQFSPEALLAADPQVLITPHRATAEHPERRPGFAALSAVRTKRVVFLPDPAIVVRPGPRVVEGVAWVARALGQ